MNKDVPSRILKSFILPEYFHFVFKSFILQLILHLHENIAYKMRIKILEKLRGVL